MITRRVWAAGAVLLTATSLLAAGASAANVDSNVTLNLRDVPLRTAIDSLFAGSGIQYSVDPNVLNVPVTLNIRDIGLPSALRLLVRQAATAQPGLTFSKDGDIYVVKIRKETPVPTQTQEDAPPEYSESATEFTWEKIPVQFNNVMVFTLAFGGTMLPTEAEVLQQSSGQSGNGMGNMNGLGGNGMGNNGSGNNGLGGNSFGNSGLGGSGLGGSYGNSGLGSSLGSYGGSGSYGGYSSGTGGRRF